MKRILVLVLLLLISLSFGAFAQVNWEIKGGAIYTTLDFREFNDDIETFNSLYEENYGSWGGNLNKMEPINSSLGFYGGIFADLSHKLKVGALYENISPSTDITFNYSDEWGTINDELTYNFKINGLVGSVAYKLNDLISINGGFGYYFGKIIAKNKIVGTGDYLLNYSDESSVDISGFGFKAGAGLDYPIADNLNLSADFNYRMLTLKGKDTPEGEGLNANGFEVCGGISYQF